MPNFIARRQNIMFPNTLHIARKALPSLMNAMVSQAKVEKVVNAPRKPMVQKSLHVEATSVRSTMMVMRNARKKLPRKLTINVPAGKYAPKILAHQPDIVYRAMAPRNPPAPTIK